MAPKEKKKKRNKVLRNGKIILETKKGVFNCYILPIVSYSVELLNNIIAYDKETWDNRKVVLREDNENNMNRACEQRVHFKENENKKDFGLGKDTWNVSCT